MSCNQVPRVANRQLSNCFCKNKHRRLLTFVIIGWKIIYQDQQSGAPRSRPITKSGYVFRLRVKYRNLNSTPANENW